MRGTRGLAEGAVVVAGLAAAATAFWLAGFLRHVVPGKSDWSALDLEMYFYPKFAYGAAALARGRVPLWNPHEFCGLPFLATAQVAALYPVKNVLFWLFSPPLALHVNYVVHLVLAGALAYAWARWLGLRAAAAAAGAALWAFNPYFLSSVYHPTRIMTLAWVPLVFLAYERALGRRTLGAAALAGAAIALQTYAGYPGFTLCLGALLALATVVEAARAGRGAPGVVVVAGASAAFAFAFAAPQVLPLAEMVGESSRESLVAATQLGGFHPSLMAVPRVLWGALASLFLFAGPAMGFAVGGLVLGRAPVRWFLAAALVLVQAGPYLEPLPGYRWLRASWSLWPIFGYFFVATLAALGVERSLRQDRGMLVLLLGAPVLAAAVGFWLARYVPASALLALALAALALVTATRPRVTAGACAALLVAMAFVTAPFGTGAAPFPTVLPDAALHTAVEEAARGGRVYAPSIVRRGQQVLSELRVLPGFETSLRPRRVGRLVDDAGLVEAIFGADWSRIAAHRPLVDLLGVSLVVPDGYVALPGFTPGPRLPDGRPTWRNPSALPRAFVVHRARAATTPEEAHAVVTDPAFRPGEEAVVEAPLPALAPPAGQERAALVADEPERVAVAAEVTAPALLVLTDSFFPGWEAEVDGTREPILRADYAFRGVALAAGEHRVVFRYRPWSFHMGVALAAGALVLALGAALGRLA